MRPKRQKVALAFLGSVLLHGIALLLFALVVAVRPPTPPTPPSEEPIQLEVVQEEPPPTPLSLPPGAASTPTPKPKIIVDAAGLDADSPPPAGALLSDRSTQASSSDQTENNPPGTVQVGRKMASFQFDPRPPAPGIVSRSEPPAPTPRPETAPELPKPDQAAARPSPTPRPTVATPPPKATPAPTAAPDEFAMAMATPPPPPEDPFDPSIRSATTPPLPKPVARPIPANAPTPAGAVRSAERGSSVTRGPGGIDTAATPASRYAHEVTDMIKYVWGRSIKRRDDSPFGTAVIHCTINQEGLALNPRIVSNTSDVVFGSIALQAVVVARLPPMPAEVVDELQGKLALDITFDFTPMPQETGAH